MRRSNQRLLDVCTAGLIAALYTVLTVIVGAFGLANGAIQLRVSEALCVLPFFTPAAIGGLTVGCLISNLLLGALWQDVIFGTLATLLGAVGAYLLRRYRVLVPLPTVLANTVIVPFVLAYAYHVEGGVWFLMITVGIGEVLSAYVLGIFLLGALEKRAPYIFSGRKKATPRAKQYDVIDRSMPQAVRRAISLLEENGYEAYVVGGCVRDAMLGRTPNDWDITTSAKPEEMKRVFAAYRCVETGIEHGTLTVILDGNSLEITTYRNDGEYLDNRHPAAVTFSKEVREDLERRDFTVNAMAYHPRRGLVDCFDGVGDLSKKTIACVGDPVKRFTEDGLRILRAVRFAAVLDFTIDAETSRAIHEHRHLLQNIAAERIREELCKLVCGVGAVRILREYHDVIAVFIPELEACVGFEQNTKYHCYDVYEHLLKTLELSKESDLCTCLAAFLHDVGKPLCYTEDENGGHFKGHGEAGTALTETILNRLRFDRATTDTVVQLVAYHDRPIAAEIRAVKRLMRVMTDENIARLIALKKFDRMAHAEAYSTPSAELDEILRLMEQVRAEDACISLRTLAIKGDDLIAMGVRPGKEIGRILNELLEAVIDEIYPNEHDVLCAAARDRIK